MKLKKTLLILSLFSLGTMSTLNARNLFIFNSQDEVKDKIKIAKKGDFALFFKDGRYSRYIFDGNKFVALVDNNVNDTPNIISTTALRSCKDIYDKGKSYGDGYYAIDPDGEGGNPPFQVYCDMTNGGWTLVANIVKTNEKEGKWSYLSPFWENNNNGATESKFFDKNSKTKAWASVKANSLKIVKDKKTPIVKITLNNQTAGEFFSTSHKCQATHLVSPPRYIPNGCWKYSIPKCDVNLIERNSYGGSGYIRLRLQKSGGCGGYWATTRSFGAVTSNGPRNSYPVIERSAPLNTQYSFFVK